MNVKTLLIVGGGTAGMCLAVLLAGRGVEVELVDLDPAWRALGAGMTVNGPTLRAFKAVGVLEEIAAAGFLSERFTVCDVDGTERFTSPPDRAFGPDIPNNGAILRPALHAILSARVRAAGVRVRLGVSVDTLEEVAGGVEVGFTDGSSGVFEAVVGADGANSAMRARLFPGLDMCRFTGQGCWRALAARPARVVHAHIYTGHGLKAGVNPVSRDQMYLFFLQHAADNPRMAEDELVAKLSEGLAPFGGLIAEVREGLGPQSQINYRPLEPGLLPLPWSRGRVVLIGDAAHVTTPHLAYGAGMAVEDAVVLAEELAAGGGEVAATLARFAERRFARCEMVVENSIAIGACEMAGGDAATEAGLMVRAGQEMLKPI